MAEPSTMEQAIIDGLESPALVWVTGSVAYGLADAGSDRDLRAIVMPTVDDYVHCRRCRERTRVDDGVDLQTYGLHHYCDMLLSNGPNAIELAGLPARHVVQASPVGDLILDVAPRLVSRKAMAGLEGYAVRQWERYVRHAAMGEGRTACKALMHSVRILRMAAELWETGELHLVRDMDRDELLEVRHGAAGMGERLRREALARLDEVKAGPTPLPAKPDPTLVEPVLERAFARAVHA